MTDKNNIYNDLKELVKKINLQYINLEVVNKNTDKFLKIFIELKKIWNILIENKTNFILKKIYKSEQDYNIILKIISESIFSNIKIITNEITNIKYIGLLSFGNIKFYWICQEFSLENENYVNIEDELYNKVLNMFMISICLNKFKYSNDDIERIIIWVPIKKERNFVHKKITDKNLTKSVENFEAFTASGVTWGSNPKITIITRYEEIEKLLIHELIHNYNIDGSKYHSEFKSIIKKYIKYKNNSNSSNKNYDYEYSIYESYTELLSTYLYLLFCNISIDNLEPNKLKEKLQGQILIELIYSFNTIGNLIKLNNYNEYNDFVLEKNFIGNICVYEYYYIKALMYNNYILEIGNNINEFKNIYKKIIFMIKKNNIHDDLLMKNIYENCIGQTNFKYIIH